MSAPATDQADGQVVALVEAQSALRAQADAAVVATAAAAARSFRRWYDTDAITEWAQQLAGIIETWQGSAARTTDAYLARILSELTGRRVAPAGAVNVGDLRPGVTHAGTYGRAADVYRWQQSQFDAIARSLLTDTPRTPDIADPVDAAVERVVKAARMDVQLAVRAQTTATLSTHEDSGIVTGYRRVIHPELSRGGTCGLCVAASDRLYKAQQLMPIHHNCHCEAVPVIDGNDAGSRLNAGDLGRLYQDASGTGREQLKRTRYQVDEHGELGPVLNPAGTRVRTDRQAARQQNTPPRRAKTDAQRHAALLKVRDELTATLPAVRSRASADRKTWSDYLSKLETRVRDLDQQLAA